MTRATNSYKALSDPVRTQLEKLGENLAIARKRRRISLAEMSKRMMVNLKTVQRMEKGDPAVGVGIVATALWILGLQRRLGELAAPESDSVALQEDIRKLPRDFRKTAKRADRFDF